MLQDSPRSFIRDTLMFLTQRNQYVSIWLFQVASVNFSCHQPLCIYRYSYSFWFHSKYKTFIFISTKHFTYRFLYLKSRVHYLLSFSFTSSENSIWLYIKSHTKLSYRFLEHKFTTSSRFHLKCIMIDFLLHIKHQNDQLQRGHGYSVSFIQVFKS